MDRNEVIECMAIASFVSGGAPLEYWAIQHEVVRQKYIAEATSQLCALEAAGYQVVPVDATEEMLTAGFDSGAFDNDTFSVPRAWIADAYRAMLAAAKDAT